MFYRLRTRLAYRYFQFATRELDSTPPLRTAPDAPCEVHTMLGHGDLRMYVLAIKSLLSFVNNVSVVVHSDGSIREGDVEYLRAHLPGVRIVDHAVADERAAQVLASRSLLREWRTHDAAYRRLIDVEIWRNAGKVIILDSDVLTNAQPDEVIAWIQGGTKPFLLGQPPLNADSMDGPPPPGAHVQRQFLAKVPELSARLDYPSAFLQGSTAGFCGYLHEISLDRVEHALRESLALELPMHQWGGDQCLVIYLLSVGAAERLPANRYLNFEPNVADQTARASVIHFYGTHRFLGFVYPRLAAAAVARLRLTT